MKTVYFCVALKKSDEPQFGAQRIQIVHQVRKNTYSSVAQLVP